MADISTGRQRGIVPFVDETTGRLPDQYLPQGVIDLQGDVEQAVSDASKSATAAKASETAAKSSETAAKASETAAARSAQTATEQVSSIGDSVERAAASATSAQQSASQAQSNATNAAASATAAQQVVDGLQTTVKEQGLKIDQNTNTISQVSQKADSLEQDINSFKTTVSETYTTKDEFNNLQVGGTNLIKGSKPYGKSGFFEHFDSVTDNKYGELTLQSTKTSQSYPSVFLDYSDTFTFDKTDIVTGDQYVISYDVMMLERTYTTSSTFTESWIGIRHDCGDWSGLIKYDGIRNDFLNAPLNEWAHFEHLVTAKAWDGTTNISARIQLGTKSVGKFHFRMRNVKLEKGTKATAWSPAPGDMLSKDEAAQTYSTKSSYQALEARVQALEAKLANQ